MAGIRQRPPVSGRKLGELTENLQRTLERNEAAVREPFVGVRTSTGRVPGLFPLRATGVRTDPIRESVEGLLDQIGEVRAATALFDVESDNWRRWSNIHRFLMRHGILLEELDDAERELALGVLRSTLSERGFELARDIMLLNGVIGELANRPEELSEWLYWLSIMGQPSGSQPWGWQIDGHHLIVNCFVLGDQIVTTPMFMGSEPVAADSDRFGAIRVFQAEEADALALMAGLGAAQREKAVFADPLPPDLFTVAFRDNVELDHQGICATDLDAVQQESLLELIGVYVGRTRLDHATVKMQEVRAHLGETFFTWMGGTEPDSVFYYRIYSPVLLIEFDHQPGIFFDNEEPSRNHVHTVVRTPNGNDYGKDLLRQHYASVAHRASRGS